MTAGRFVLFAPLQSLLAFWMDGNDERVARTPLRRVDMAWLRDDTGAVGLGDGVRDAAWLRVGTGTQRSLCRAASRCGRLCDGVPQLAATGSTAVLVFRRGDVAAR